MYSTISQILQHAIARLNHNERIGGVGNKNVSYDNAYVETWLVPKGVTSPEHLETKCGIRGWHVKGPKDMATLPSESH